MFLSFSSKYFTYLFITTDETREIFKYHEFTIGEYTFRWFYDRVKNTKSTECKDKKLYCVHCKECFSAHTSEKRFSHACKQKDLDKKLNGQAESDKITKILRRKRF